MGARWSSSRCRRCTSKLHPITPQPGTPVKNASAEDCQAWKDCAISLSLSLTVEGAANSTEAGFREVLARTFLENVEAKVLFGHLRDRTLRDAFAHFTLEWMDKGRDVVRQGEEGDRLYVVATGEVQVFVLRMGDNDDAGKGSRVTTLHSGAMFGQFALIHNMPRAATVTVTSDGGSQMWCLDRKGLDAILGESVRELNRLYDGWLLNVPLLKPLNKYELGLVADQFVDRFYVSNQIVVKQGDIAHNFYVLRDGSCGAFITNSGSGAEREIRRYTAVGDYFGEASLLSGQRRGATVRALGPDGAHISCLNRDAFWTLLAPVMHHLVEALADYPEFAESFGVESFLVAGDAYNNPASPTSGGGILSAIKRKSSAKNKKLSRLPSFVERLHASKGLPTLLGKCSNDDVKVNEP